MNLCTNAAHAMRDTGGVLEVSLTETDFDTPAAGQFLDLAPGPYVRLAVSDTGHGMDHSVMERIFDPYFTTKRPGEGTGLGLAVVHGIVKSHGGALTVESEAGKGTTFQVFIPRLKRGPVEHETGTTAPVPEGNERILFVDDEKALVDSGSKILEHLGYEVVARTSSIEALETFRTRPEIFDLVISDQTMPHMTGVELARELMHIRPDIPVILCTGFSERVTPEKAKAEGIREFIMKPLSLRNFAETVRKVLDGQRETSNQQPATSNQNGKRVDH